MQKWLIILMLLFVALLGFEFWLLKQPQNKKTTQTNINSPEPEVKAGCEWEGKTYNPGKPFLIWLSAGCSLCFCGSDGGITCQKVDCPKGGRND